MSATEYLDELATLVFPSVSEEDKIRLSKQYPDAVWTRGGPKEEQFELVEIVIHEKQGRKTYKGHKSGFDVLGKIASSFNYERLCIDENVVVEIGNRKFITDIHDFHNALRNEDYSVFNANKNLDMEPEFYVIPLG